MQEKRLREIHRTLAIWLVILIILQVVSGLTITVGSFFDFHEHAVQGHGESIETSNHDNHDGNVKQVKVSDIISTIHHGGGFIGKLYRVFLSLGMLGIITTGIMIFAKIRARTKKT